MGTEKGQTQKKDSKQQVIKTLPRRETKPKLSNRTILMGDAWISD